MFSGFRQDPNPLGRSPDSTLAKSAAEPEANHLKDPHPQRDVALSRRFEPPLEDRRLGGPVEPGDSGNRYQGGTPALSRTSYPRSVNRIGTTIRTGTGMSRCFAGLNFHL